MVKTCNEDEKDDKRIRFFFRVREEMNPSEDLDVDGGIILYM